MDYVQRSPASFHRWGQHSEFHELKTLFGKDQPAHQADTARLWSLILNAKAAATRCPGSFAEVGVYKGNSAAVLAHYAEQFGRRMYLIDTFTGFPQDQLGPHHSDETRAAFRDTSIAIAQDIVGQYPGNRWLAGCFPESASDELKADRFAFVSIDCDVYQPILDSLSFFYPRLDAGGVLVVHDYSSTTWPEATKAVDEFCKANSVAGILLPDLAGTIAFVRSPRQV